IPFVPTMTKTSSTLSVPQSKFRISTITGGANVHRVFISSSIAEQRWSTNDARFSIQRHRRLRLAAAHRRETVPVLDDCRAARALRQTSGLAAQGGEGRRTASYIIQLKTIVTMPKPNLVYLERVAEVQ